ncbi:OsmC family protein [Kaistia terrae]|uniref:OsmC family protein n=1 Tax=Kaistia terrae TaxID=537017 RepID=A0ABW0PXV1_9HYPH|nr:OsmC family protein [Kaistia terrae]MCX5581662.1 OsmC family protein [Kaistia terrae]
MRATLNTIWTGDMKSSGTIQAQHLEMPIAIPSEFGGSGDGTDPKSLLVASAAACYAMTLVAILENRKVPVTKVTMESDASDSKGSGIVVDHRPLVNLAADATQEQSDAARSAFETADKACAVGNLLKKAGVQIRIDGAVSVIG